MQNINSIIKILAIALVLVVGLILVQNHYSKARQAEFDAGLARAAATEQETARAEAAAAANAEYQKQLVEQQAQNMAKGQIDTAPTSTDNSDPNNQANADNAALLTKVKQSMKDPDSTQFKELKFGFSENQPAVCGRINAKNGFGGYTGFEGFFAGYSKDGIFNVYLQSDTKGFGSLLFDIYAKKLGCTQ